MTDILQKTYPLTASDIDGHRLLRPSALLSYLQNMATEHADLLGIGGDVILAEHGAFWMMARLYLRLNRPIAFADREIAIHTWHRGATKSAIIYRDFDFFAGGEHLGEAVISWVLADVRDRKLVKPASIPEIRESPRPERVKDIVPAKIKLPEGLSQAMVRQVYYSDTDINGHMNNTKYADIACDAIRYENCCDQFLSELQINYLCECFPGDELFILRGGDGDIHYVRGTDAAGKNRFDVSMRLGVIQTG